MAGDTWVLSLLGGEESLECCPMVVKVSSPPGSRGHGWGSGGGLSFTTVLPLCFISYLPFQ